MTPAQRQALVKLPGALDRVLTGHGVSHQQGFGGSHQVLDLLQLLHERVIDMESARGIDQENVAAAGPGLHKRRAAELQRIIDALSPETGKIEVSGNHGELFPGSRPVHVDGEQQGPMTVAVQPAGQLSGRGSLARTLQAHHQVDGRRLAGEGKSGGFPSQQLHQLVPDDLDDLLGRRQRLQNFLTGGPGPDGLHELLDHPKVDVRFQESQTNLPQGAGDVSFRELAFASKSLEHSLQALGQLIEHIKGTPP